MNMLAIYIAEAVDEYLSGLGVHVKCEDYREEQEHIHQEEGSKTALYGMEYWGMVEEIEAVINSKQGYTSETGDLDIPQLQEDDGK